MVILDIHARMLKLTSIRLQFWEHHFPLFLPIGRAPLPIGVEEDWPRSVDSAANHPLVNCCHVPVCH